VQTVGDIAIVGEKESCCCNQTATRFSLCIAYNRIIDRFKVNKCQQEKCSTSKGVKFWDFSSNSTFSEVYQLGGNNGRMK